MKILVLGGGNSPERDVSLRSAAAVQQALEALGHEVSFADPQAGGETIRPALEAAEIVFPILHGEGGEDGTVQAIIESAGKPYLGADVIASKLCYDKSAYKERLVAAGIQTPTFAVVDAAAFAQSEIATRPYVLKPITGGSSLDTFIVRDPEQHPPGIAAAFGRYPQMLLEELIEGVEITVAVLDETALPVIEIIPPEGQDFDYDNKYNGATTELCPPRNIDTVTQLAAQRLAENIHRLMGVRHLSRTDMMVASGSLWVLETNTMPGMTNQSLLPKAAMATGMTWDELAAQLVRLVTRSS